MHNERYTHKSIWLPKERLVNKPSEPESAETVEKYDEKSLSPFAASKYSDLEKSTGRTHHERQFLLKALGKLPPSSVDVMLDAMPASEIRPVLDIDLPQCADAETAHFIFDKFAEIRLDGLKEKCLDDCQKTIDTSRRLQDLMSVVRDHDSAHVDGNIVEYLGSVSEEARRSEAEMMGSVADYAALQCVKNARVFGDQVTFPQDVANIPGFSEAFTDFVKARKVLSRMVSESIQKIFEDDIEFIVREELPPIKTKLREPHFPFALMDVEYKSAEEAYFLLMCFFLSPGDKIVHVSSDIREMPENTYATSVLVQLASENLPPKYATSGRHKDYLKYCKERSSEYKSVKSLEKIIESLEKTGSDSHAQEILVQTYRRSLQWFQKCVKSKERRISMLSKKPYMSHIPDLCGRKTEVIFPQGYCTVCHTSAHTFVECPERGCKLCYNRNHAASRCPFKCGCKKGKTHAFEGCISPKPLREVNGRKLSEIRRRNDPTQKALIY